MCYVWDAHFPIGSVLDNAFTRRVRLMVLRGANTPLTVWSSERRDLHADFLLLFGDEASTVPDIVGVTIGADADNTQSRSLSYIAGRTAGIAIEGAADSTSPTPEMRRIASSGRPTAAQICDNAPTGTVARKVTKMCSPKKRRK